MAPNSPIRAPWGSHIPVPWPRVLFQPSLELSVVLQGWLSGYPAAPQQSKPTACHPHSHRDTWGCLSCLPGLPCSLSKPLECGLAGEAQRDPSCLLVPGSRQLPVLVALSSECVSSLTLAGFVFLSSPQEESSQSRDLKQLIYNSVVSPSCFPFMELCIVLCHLKTDLNKAMLWSNLQEI